MSNTTEAVDLAGWLTRIWDEEEAIALEASRHDEEPLVEGGEHWLWACDEHDEVITPDLLTQDVLACPQDIWKVSLRSTEQYPYRSIKGTGPSIHFSAEEVPPSVALHILRHDPASDLARIAADRKILAACERVYRAKDREYGDGSHDLADEVMGNLAAQYADRPGFQEAWR